MTSTLSKTTLIVGIVVLVGFGVLTFYMIRMNSKLPADQQWDHLVVIFNSIQAMAAAALGVLLGTTVQQARVDAANARAKLFENERRQYENDAIKNNAIRSLLAERQTLQRDAAEPGDPTETLKAVRALLNT